MQLHYRSADIELLLLDIMVWRDEEVSLVENDSGENLNKFTDWAKDQKSERFNRKGQISVLLQWTSLTIQQWVKYIFYPARLTV